MRNDRFIFALKALLFSLAALFVLFMAVGLYLYRLSLTLPELGMDPTRIEAPRTSIIYASDGSVLTEWHGEQDRKVVRLDVVPQSLRDAVVAIEDERFYEHHGVDTLAIARALRVDAASRAYAQGGSTITQQLVKLMFTDGRRTLTRKVREALLAYQIEYRTEKDKVLESYLNIVYLGNGRYGVESASRAYFGKPVSDLTLTESAMLAGIIKAPTAFAPSDHYQEALARRNTVLAKMLELGFITQTELREALRERPVIAPQREPASSAPYFLEYVKRDLVKRLGADRVFNGGLRIQTTLDPELQKEAEKAARLLSRKKDPEIAVVSVEFRTGRIVALVGGRDFDVSQFNLATQGRRQPGSAFKPFVLVTALKAGIQPDSVFAATPYSVRVTDGVWNVQNYENAKTAPTMTLRTATNWSVNAVYARLIMRVGAGNVVQTARDMGIESPLDANPAIALGGLREGVSPLEMASAYGTIANSGVRVPTRAVDRIETDDGELIYASETVSARAIPESVAAKASLMLHDVVERGTGTGARIGKVWAAGKTGTTQSYRDAWFVGWAGDLSTAVWVGFPQAQVDMTNVRGIKVTGGSYPAQVWRAYMSKALALENSPVTAPSETADQEDGTTVTLCSETLQLANKRCPRKIDVYLERSLVPKQVCTKH